MDPKKLEHEYITYSGYPGGLKSETRAHLKDRLDWKEVIVRTVKRMLPNNKLRDRMLKNLVINN
jgi:large subunit ribosomal protein L13